MSLASVTSSKKPVLPKTGDTGHVNSVVVDGLVVLKIMKHARENPQDAASGPLLGLVVDHILEVTHSFPLPRQMDDEEFLHEQYQTDMMRLLREVNVDHMQVGWYQISSLGAFLSEDLIAVQYDYQNALEETVVLIYDPVRTQQGTLTLRAFRFTEAFMQLYREKNFTPQSLKKMKLSHDNILEEVPLQIKTSHLGRALLDELDKEMRKTQTSSFDRLDLNTQSFLEKNVRLLMDCVDELSNDSQKFHMYQRNLARQEQLRRQFQEKRKQENAIRIKNGQAVLPEDDPEAFKPAPPPSRLESLLITGQIAHYCSQISQFSSQSFGKLFLAQGLQTPSAN
eukprot:m.118383 g.118383  ORF g.118383 m.118383 type:complete len:339 (+) comp16116_c0_seq1:96-1112(+)